jgi:NarL family two-component system response regulator LiaR
MRILIVDDHVLFRQGLVSLFKAQSDFEVVGEAGTVREALQNARLLQPDLVLMDFNLPDGTGLEATEAILAELPACKIVFLTIYETEERLFEAIRKGAKGYMLKDTPISNLLASLRAVERGEPALSRGMMASIIEEFAHTPKSMKLQANPLIKLSHRELEILREVARGASNQEIAGRLFLSENTVKHHVHNILKKLELENRRQLASFANEHGVQG